MTSRQTDNKFAPADWLVMEHYKDYTPQGRFIADRYNLWVRHPDLSDADRRLQTEYAKYDVATYRRLITTLLTLLVAIPSGAAAVYTHLTGWWIAFGCAIVLNLILTAFQMRGKLSVEAQHKNTVAIFEKTHPGRPVVAFANVEPADISIITLCTKLSALFNSRPDERTRELRKQAYIATRQYPEQGAAAFEALFPAYEAFTGEPVFTPADNTI